MVAQGCYPCCHALVPRSAPTISPRLALPRHPAMTRCILAGRPVEYTRCTTKGARMAVRLGFDPELVQFDEATAGRLREALRGFDFKFVALSTRPAEAGVAKATRGDGDAR